MKRRPLPRSGRQAGGAEPTQGDGDRPVQPGGRVLQPPRPLHQCSRGEQEAGGAGRGSGVYHREIIQHRGFSKEVFFALYPRFFTLTSVYLYTYLLTCILVL